MIKINIINYNVLLLKQNHIHILDIIIKPLILHNIGFMTITNRLNVWNSQNINKNRQTVYSLSMLEIILLCNFWQPDSRLGRVRVVTVSTFGLHDNDEKKIAKTLKFHLW